MIKFSATFGNIVLKVRAGPYLGRTDTLPLTVEDRTDIASGEALIYELSIQATDQATAGLSIDFIEPFVVVTHYEDDEETMEEIAEFIEDALLTKIELHLELEQSSSSTPPWAQKE